MTDLKNSLPFSILEKGLCIISKIIIKKKKKCSSKYSKMHDFTTNAYYLIFHFLKK